MSELEPQFLCLGQKNTCGLTPFSFKQNIVLRVANLPLVSSTYDMVSTAYITTKDNHPYLKSVCEIAEKGMKTITSVAMTSAMPIIQKLEPQSKAKMKLLITLVQLIAFCTQMHLWFNMVMLILKAVSGN